MHETGQNRIFTYASLSMVVLASFLFYGHLNGATSSDFIAHASKSWEGPGYSLLHYVTRLVSHNLPIKASRAEVYHYALLFVFTVLSLHFTLAILKNHFAQRYPDSSQALCGLMPIALLLASMIIINPFARHVYVGIGTPNPWHNPTFLLCRVFSLLLFFEVLDVVDTKSPPLRSYVRVSAFSVLSMWSKPAFCLSFFPAIAAFCIFGIIKSNISLRRASLLALALAPSLIVLLLIYDFVYTGADTSIIFAPGKVISYWSQKYPPYTRRIMFVFPIFFPLYVLLTSLKKNMTIAFKLSLINFTVSYGMWYFLAETGRRMLAGNMGWSFLFGLFFLFVASCEQYFFTGKRSRTDILLGSALFALHIFSGIMYLAKYFYSGSYY